MLQLSGSYCLQKPRYLHNPHGWIQHIPFAFYLMETCRPSLVVELGTYSGNSYFAFCQAVKDLQLPTRCVAVDTWQGDIHVGSYGDAVLERVRQINDREFAGFSALMPMHFDEALAHFKDGSIDLLHIDGTHTYQAAKHDFYSWLPKMSPAGTILLHDTQVKDRGFGVYKLLDELRSQFAVFEFPFSEGLAVVSVARQFNACLEPFIREAHTDPQQVLWFEKLGENILLQREKETFASEVHNFRKKTARLNVALLQKQKEIKQLKKKLKSR